MYGMKSHQGILFLILLLYLGPSPTNELHYGLLYNKTDPYMVIIKNNFEHGFTVCSGALITLKWVLTHAPCLYSLNGPVSVYIRSESVYNPGQIAAIKRTVIQEGYREEIGARTLALVELDQRAKLRGGEYPIPITKYDVSYYYRPGGGGCVLKGYGYKRNSKESVISYGILTWGTVTSIKSSAANNHTCGCLEPGILKPEQLDDLLCTDQGRVGRICVGDFGAPLVCFQKVSDTKDQTNPILVGVANNYVTCSTYRVATDYQTGKVLPCSSANVTDIYTDVYMYRTWISKVISRKVKSPEGTAHKSGGPKCREYSTDFKIIFLVIFLFFTGF